MDKKDKLKRQLRWAIIAVIASWIAIPVIIFFYYGKPNSPAVLGDSFGVVNALFSALAFALLIYTSMMQREELELQRNELELTRKELEKSAIAQETLVKLTSEQLELDKLIRKSQIKAELILKEVRPTPQQDRYAIQVFLTVKYNRIKIFKITLRGAEQFNYSLDSQWVEIMRSKYHEPNNDVVAIIESQIQTTGYPNGLEILIYFDDIDTKSYYQKISFEDDKVLVGGVISFNKASLLL